MISMEEQKQIPNHPPYTYFVRNNPIMPAALDVFTILNKHGKALLLAKGLDIPAAVAITNIIVEKMLHKSCKTDYIKLDSEDVVGKRMLSTIEISISKT
ncbi:MAG: DNA-binding protein [Candidatus Nitrosotenuis sp.]